MSPFESAPLPEIPTTLASLSKAVQGHYKEHPAHTAGCTCLDPMIIAIARDLLPRDGEGYWRQAAVGSDRTRDGLAHVLTEIARRL
jgi:hypothetical protein